MRFVLPAAAVDDSVTTLDALDRLLHRVADEVHVLVLPDAELLEQTSWFRGLRRHRQDLLRQAVLASAFRPVPASGPHRILYTVGIELDPVQAASLAYAPLVILVENERTDGLLVHAAIHAHGSSEVRRLWSTAFATGPSATLRSRGGTGELGHLVRELCEEAALDHLPVRLLVMTDSDGRFPGEVSSKAASLGTECATRNVPIKILSCKAIENYIPDQALDLWSSAPARTGARSLVDALKRLAPEARDHFPMKGRRGVRAPRPNRGMAAVAHPDAPMAQKALFASVSPEDCAALADGFDDTIIINAIGEEHLSQLSAADFNARDQRGDLQHLATMIADLL